MAVDLRYTDLVLDCLTMHERTRQASSRICLPWSFSAYSSDKRWLSWLQSVSWGPVCRWQMVGARKRVEDADSAEQVIHSSLSLLMGLDMVNLSIA